MRSFSLKWGLIPAIMLITNCGSPGSGTDSTVDTSTVYSKQGPMLKVDLVDAPNMDLTKVNVKIKHVELWLSKDGVNKRVIVAQGLGDVDLLTLQNGVSLPILNAEMPAQVQVTKIRLILEEEGHYANKIDGSVCDMKTPSAQKSGVKLKLPETLTLQNGSVYKIVVDFDALKSVVQKGNGGCNLKPVLKLKSATQVIVDDDNGDGNTDDGEGQDPADDLTDGDDYNNDDDNDGTGSDDGYDNGDGSDGGEEIPIEDLPIYF